MVLAGGKYILSNIFLGLPKPDQVFGQEQWASRLGVTWNYS